MALLNLLKSFAIIREAMESFGKVLSIKVSGDMICFVFLKSSPGGRQNRSREGSSEVPGAGEKL